MPLPDFSCLTYSVYHVPPTLPFILTACGINTYLFHACGLHLILRFSSRLIISSTIQFFPHLRQLRPHISCVSDPCILFVSFYDVDYGYSHPGFSALSMLTATRSIHFTSQLSIFNHFTTSYNVRLRGFVSVILRCLGVLDNFRIMTVHIHVQTAGRYERLNTLNRLKYGCNRPPLRPVHLSFSAAQKIECLAHSCYYLACDGTEQHSRHRTLWQAPGPHPPIFQSCCQIPERHATPQYVSPSPSFNFLLYFPSHLPVQLFIACYTVHPCLGMITTLDEDTRPHPPLV